MSIDSAASSSQELPPFKHQSDLNLSPNKQLQATLSHSDRFPLSRHSLKSATRERHQQQRQSNSRHRATSVTEDPPTDAAATELTPTPAFSNKQDNKHEPRSNQLKVTTDRPDHTSIDRRYSTPQLHFSSLIPHAFRNAKNHHQNTKTNTKDETNAANLPLSNANASTANSYLLYSDMTTMKADPSLSLKSSASITTGPRLTALNSNDRVLTSQNEESASSPSLFILDASISEPRSAESFITESHTPLCLSEIYHEQFFDHFHINYSGEFEHEVPFIASLRYIYDKAGSTDNCEARALIRTPNRNYKLSEIVNGTNETHILRVLFNKVHLPPVHTYGAIGDPKANEKIYAFDKRNDERYNCKIGVINQRSKQTNEYDIFSNDSLSPDMCNFLDIISHRVNLKGYSKYRGDLDTKDDLHGEYSYYTEYENHEIMFNIAPIIPSTKANGQCIERKGLVGNAFVSIVFQEPGANFLPEFISGRVTQVYITVKPCIIDGELYYKVATWRRNDITSIIDPPGGLYKYDKSFRYYFLTLLLNSINVAIESPSLRALVFERRQRLKHAELKHMCDTFNVGPIPDFAGDIDNINYSPDTRPSTRTESNASNATAATSDSASTNPGRVSPVSSKKKGFSKFFGVFSGRSGSVSSVPFNQGSNDVQSPNPQTPATADAIMTLGRTTTLSNKEIAKRSRSIKLNQAPTPPLRPPMSLPNQTISIQPPTPPSVTPYPNSPNPLSFASDNLTQNNLSNKSAWDASPRSRSNSSPEDTVNTNKPQSLSGSTIDEESDLSDSTDDESSDEESTDDERPPNRPTLINRPIINPSKTNS